jgi:hypothetical protein
MLTRDRRPDFRTMDRWTMGLLLEAGAIHKCDLHGWAAARAVPHDRAEALRLAQEEPLAGLSPDEGVAGVGHVLESVGNAPESDSPILLPPWNPAPPDRLSPRPLHRIRNVQPGTARRVDIQVQVSG